MNYNTEEIKGIAQLVDCVHAKVVSNLCSSRRPRRRLQGKPCAEDGARSNLPDMFCVHNLWIGIMPKIV